MTYKTGESFQEDFWHQLEVWDVKRQKWLPVREWMCDDEEAEKRAEQYVKNYSQSENYAWRLVRVRRTTLRMKDYGGDWTARYRTCFFNGMKSPIDRAEDGEYKGRLTPEEQM